MADYSFRNMRMWSMLGACGAFGVAAMDLPKIVPNTVVLTADLTFFSGLERFKTLYPDRLYNLGIAEQNMVGVAAGFAKEGFVPFATTYAAFASLRSADQVKVNMGYMKLPIKLVGLTSGYSVGVLGATHICLEDIAMMRAIPNITVLSPADCASVVKAVLAAAVYPGPVYLRLSGSMNNPMVYRDDFCFNIGKANQLRQGRDIAILATGSMVYYALESAKQLEHHGICADVYDFHTISPLDKETIVKCIDKRLLVTIEEHSRHGGFGSAVAETISIMADRPRHLILGTDGEYPHAAQYGDLLDKAGLTVETITNKIIKTIEGDNVHDQH